MPGAGVSVHTGPGVAPSDRLLSATAVDLYLSYRSDKGSFTARPGVAILSVSHLTVSVYQGLLPTYCLHSRNTWLACSYCHFLMAGRIRKPCDHQKRCQRTWLAGDSTAGDQWIKLNAADWGYS